MSDAFRTPNGTRHLRELEGIVRGEVPHPDIHDEKESLVAKVYSTCMALRGDEAKGR